VTKQHKTENNYNQIQLTMWQLINWH